MPSRIVYLTLICPPVWVDQKEVVKLGVQDRSMYTSSENIKVGNGSGTYWKTYKFEAEGPFFPSSELSHRIFAIAISHVSRTVRLESERYLVKMGIEDGDDMAPIASAAYLVRNHQ